MKICIAQIRPFRGSIEKNLVLHEDCIRKASANNADIIVFPELSLTGYEPSLAAALSKEKTTKDFSSLQLLCDQQKITIIAGAPFWVNSNPGIGAIIFQPGKDHIIYLKQYLHTDELPYFDAGTKQEFIELSGEKIGLAICYELSVTEHTEGLLRGGTTIYLASVAKTDKGMKEAFKLLPAIAKKYHLPVLICNSVGDQDNFLAAGSSAVWNNQGDLLAALNETEESLLIFNSHTNAIEMIR